MRKTYGYWDKETVFEEARKYKTRTEFARNASRAYQIAREKCWLKEMEWFEEVRKPREEFIREAKEIHGNKYDYSKVEYVNNRTKVCIICPEHGEFWQRPHDHLRGHGCQKCGFITTAKKQTKFDTYESVKECASKCTHRADFKRKYEAAYNSARKNGWLDILFPVKKVA